jgi:perosamine synthetase
MVPMHTFGHPVDIEALLAIAHDFHLQLIEDAAESLGSTVGGQHTGTFGLMGTLSFQWQQDHHHGRRRGHPDQ